VQRAASTAVSRRRLAQTAAALGLLLFSSGALAQAKAEHTVTIADMNYGSIPTGLKVGDTITWINHDTVPHTVTARDHSFDLRLNPGQSARLTLQKSGTILFYCSLHSMMRGTLSVAAK
jgi:plastocyanin